MVIVFKFSGQEYIIIDHYFEDRSATLSETMGGKAV